MKIGSQTQKLRLGENGSVGPYSRLQKTLALLGFALVAILWIYINKTFISGIPSDPPTPPLASCLSLGQKGTGTQAGQESNNDHHKTPSSSKQRRAILSDGELRAGQPIRVRTQQTSTLVALLRQAINLN